LVSRKFGKVGVGYFTSDSAPLLWNTLGDVSHALALHNPRVRLSR